MAALATGEAAPSARDRHRVRRVLLVVGIILALLAAAFTIYASVYYHADERAQAACVADGTVAINDTADALVFGDPQTARAGFIFYPGAKVQAEAYAPLMRTLADKGFLCVIEKMPCNLAFFRIDAAQQAIGAYPQVTRWFVGGHSLGGAMASMWAAGNSTKIDGIVFLGSYPAADLSTTSLRALSLYGSEDGVLNRASYANAAASRPASWTEQVIEGGNHAGFGDYGAQEGDGTATISAQQQQQMTADALAAFME